MSYSCEGWGMWMRRGVKGEYHTVMRPADPACKAVGADLVWAWGSLLVGGIRGLYPSQGQLSLG